jgi:peptidoglycan L-alanyl-D-glutamate endopeptidase CwlK
MTEIVTSLDALEEPFRSKVRGILSDAVERRVYFVITETRRSYERQKFLFEDGKSRTMRSNHLIGIACDVAPVTAYSDGVVQGVTWDNAHPAWKVLGELAGLWGVTWGGRWQGFPDYPHLELS